MSAADLYRARVEAYEARRALMGDDDDRLACCGASGQYGHALGCPELLAADGETFDVVTCQGCGAYASYRMFGKEHIRNGEPCGIYL